MIMAPNRRLKQARELRGWSQAKVAEQIGTDATTVSRWERGLFLPTPHFRERLCTLFGNNAEELGLLASTGSLEQSSSKFRQGESSEARNTTNQDAPAQSASQDIDTFAHILQSASQEQQAYMLWEHAYVRVLQNQRAHAQQLGEASITVFEQAKHPSAAAVRTWLQQQGLAPTSPVDPNDPPQKTRRKKSSRRWFRLGDTGLFFMSIFIMGLLIASLVFHWSLPSSPSNSSLHPAHPPTTSDVPFIPAQAALPTPPQPTPAPHTDKDDNAAKIPVASPHTVKATVTPQLTPSPSVSGTPSTNNNTTATATPSQLTPQTCAQEGAGYRCMLTVKLYSTTTTTFNWLVSTTDLPARFNPTNGRITTGQPIEVIIYIDTSLCNQTGRILFRFTSSTPTTALSIYAPWHC